MAPVKDERLQGIILLLAQEGILEQQKALDYQQLAFEKKNHHTSIFSGRRYCRCSRHGLIHLAKFWIATVKPRLYGFGISPGITGQ